MPNASEPQKLSIFPYFIGFLVGILGIFTGWTDEGKPSSRRSDRLLGEGAVGFAD
jgi:hypothetical protein